MLIRYIYCTHLSYYRRNVIWLHFDGSQKITFINVSFQWGCGWIKRANTIFVLLSSNIGFIRHVKKYFEWREYLGIVWWLKYFYNKEENTIKNMIKFHQGLVFPFTLFSLSQELKVILLWFTQILLGKDIILRKLTGSTLKIICFLDWIEFTLTIIVRTKQYKERKKRYETDHITKMLSRKMTSESYPNLRGSLWNLWIKVALPLSYKIYIFVWNFFLYNLCTWYVIYD